MAYTLVVTTCVDEEAAAIVTTVTVPLVAAVVVSTSVPSLFPGPRHPELLPWQVSTWLPCPTVIAAPLILLLSALSSMQ